MELGADLSPEALAVALPGRPVRSYPALLSTEAAALAWARSGAPHGAVVTAGYQASPRGRAGFEWQVDWPRDLVFSAVLRAALPAEREGWLYAAAVSAVADVLAPAAIEWPDTVSGTTHGAVGVHAELGPAGVSWAVVNVHLRDVGPPRGPTVARVTDALDAHLAREPDDLLGEYNGRCRTLGRRVTARMIPLGPGGVVVDGQARAVLADGALVIETAEHRRVAVRPQHLGILGVR